MKAPLIIVAIYIITCSCETRAWKKIRFVINGARTHDLCDTGAVLYQLAPGSW